MDTVHNLFETEVAQHFQTAGFKTPVAVTYHNAFPADIVGDLKQMYDFTSLYLRGRADRVAINRQIGVSIEFEPKTVRKYPNFGCEALPLCHHIQKSRLGCRCLYPVRHLQHKYEYGMWISDSMPTVTRVSIPNRWTQDKQEQFKQYFLQFWPETKTEYQLGTHGGGSRDPWVLIESSVIKHLPHWKDMITEFVRQQRAKCNAPAT